MVKKIKTVSGVRSLIKHEKTYGVAIQEQIIRPILSEVLIKFENAPANGAIWSQILNEELANIQANEILGREVATEAMDNIRHYHRERMLKSFQAAIGVDINPFMSELNIRPMMTKALSENINLIKSIPRETLPKVLAEFDSILTTKGFDQQALLEVLSNKFKVANNRAEFIARNETQKIIGTLNETRQKSLGINEYMWQTMEDLIVVGNPAGKYPDGKPGHMNHFVRNGVIFSWDNPPPDGHPGQPFN